MKRPIYWSSLLLVMLVATAAHAVENNALVEPNVVNDSNGLTSTISAQRTISSCLYYQRMPTV